MSGLAHPPTDHVFARAQQKLLADYTAGFEHWLDASAQEGAHGSTDDAYTGTLADLVSGRRDWTQGVNSRSQRRVSQVYDLASLCRQFVVGDMATWAFLHQRMNASPEEIQRAIETRRTLALNQTRAKKWLVGLRYLHRPWDSVFGDFSEDEEPWIATAWKVVVEEAIPSWVRRSESDPVRRSESDPPRRAFILRRAIAPTLKLTPPVLFC